MCVCNEAYHITSSILHTSYGLKNVLCVCACVSALIYWKIGAYMYIECVCVWVCVCFFPLACILCVYVSVYIFGSACVCTHSFCICVVCSSSSIGPIKMVKCLCQLLLAVNTTTLLHR